MNILSDDIKELIKKLAIPASVGTLFQTLYNIADTYFAGKISPEALSALTKSFPIYFIIIASSIGITVAGTSLIGNSIGEKNNKNASIYFCQLIFFSFLIILLITFIGLNYASDLFSIMGSTNEVINLGLQYTDIIFLGSFIFILVVALNSLLHAEGDTKTYRNALILSFFLNILLNPILIFGFYFIPALGMKGIAIATLIAQTVAFLIIFKKVLKSKLIKNILISYFIPKFFFFKKYFFSIYANNNFNLRLFYCFCYCIQICRFIRRICSSWLWSWHQNRTSGFIANLGNKYSNYHNYCSKFWCTKYFKN